MATQETMEIPAAPRWCYWIDEVQDPARYSGYIASRVTEGEPGHAPLVIGSRPAYGVWGTTLEEAKTTAAAQNAALGLTPDQVLEIRLSSLRASGMWSTHR